MSEKYTHPLPDFDIVGFIHAVEPDQYGRIMPDEQQRRVIIDFLTQLGIAGEEQSDTSVDQGIADAQWLVSTGEATQTLVEHHFIDEEEISEKSIDLPIASIDFPSNDPVMINWNKISGAAGFDSWLGRGGGEANSSLRKIFDFATRETQLPSIDLQIILRQHEAVVLATNSHRAAAAILRNEQVRCDYLQILDARNVT